MKQKLRSQDVIGQICSKSSPCRTGQVFLRSRRISESGLYAVEGVQLRNEIQVTLLWESTCAIAQQQLETIDPELVVLLTWYMIVQTAPALVDSELNEMMPTFAVIWDLYLFLKQELAACTRGSFSIAVLLSVEVLMLTGGTVELTVRLKKTAERTHTAWDMMQPGWQDTHMVPLMQVRQPRILGQQFFWNRFSVGMQAVQAPWNSAGERQLQTQAKANRRKMIEYSDRLILIQYGYIALDVHPRRHKDVILQSPIEFNKTLLQAAIPTIKSSASVLKLPKSNKRRSLMVDNLEMGDYCLLTHVIINNKFEMKANLYSSNATSTTHVTRDTPLHPCPSCRCKSPNSSISGQKRASINKIRFMNGNGTQRVSISGTSQIGISNVVRAGSPIIVRNASPAVMRGESPRTPLNSIKFVYDGHQSLLGRNRSHQILKPQSPIRYQYPHQIMSPTSSPGRVPGRQSIYYQKYTNQKTPEKPKILQAKKDRPERRQSSSKKGQPQPMKNETQVPRNVFMQQLPLRMSNAHVVHNPIIHPAYEVQRLQRFVSQPPGSLSNSRAQVQLHSNSNSNVSSILPSFSLTPSVTQTINQSESALQTAQTPSVSIFNYVSSLPPRSQSPIQVTPQQLLTNSRNSISTQQKQILPIITSVESVKPIPEIASTPSSDSPPTNIIVIPPSPINKNVSWHQQNQVLPSITPIDALWKEDEDRQNQNNFVAREVELKKPLTNSEYLRLSERQHNSPTSLQIISNKIQNQNQNHSSTIKTINPPTVVPKMNVLAPSPPLSIRKPISNQIGVFISKPTSQSIDVYELRPASTRNQQVNSESQHVSTAKETSLQIITENTEKARKISEQQLEYELAKSITTELDLHYDYYYRTDDSDRSMSVHVEL